MTKPKIMKAPSKRSTRIARIRNEFPGGETERWASACAGHALACRPENRRLCHERTGRVRYDNRASPCSLRFRHQMRSKAKMLPSDIFLFSRRHSALSFYQSSSNQRIKTMDFPWPARCAFRGDREVRGKKWINDGQCPEFWARRILDFTHNRGDAYPGFWSRSCLPFWGNSVLMYFCLFHSVSRADAQFFIYNSVQNRVVTWYNLSPL